jgi:hypothetical protein
MKTSNKILIAAGLFLLACLIAYDFTLKTEYEKGAYKSRFYGMTEIKLKDFNAINHRAGNMVGLQIEQGKTYGVWISKYYKDKVKITRQGKTLNIDYVNYDESDVHHSGYALAVTVICPVMTNVNATAYVPQKPELGFSLNGSILISGFKQSQPLSIKADKWIEVNLSNNTLTQLNADLGTTLEDAPKLTIDLNNHIQNANINLNGKSALNLYNPAIVKPNYHFSDSTTVTLSGSSLKLMQLK